MPLGRFKSFGSTFFNSGSNPMGKGMGLGQSLFNQFFTRPGVQNQMPNIMRGFQGMNPLFGPPGNPQAPPQQVIPAQPTTAPSQRGGWFQDLLSRFGVGK